MIELLVIVICLMLNALLAGSEMAFVSASRPSIRESARQGDKRAHILLGLRESPERTLAVIQIGITLIAAVAGAVGAHILLGLRESPERTLAVIQIGITLIAAVAGAVGGAGAEESLSPLLAQYLGEGKALADFLAIGLVVLPLTYATVVIGELFPKSIALRNSLRLALYVAPVLQLLDRWLGPLVSLLERSTNLLIRWCTACRRHEEPLPQDDHTLELSPLSSQHRQYVLELGRS
jgi:putative hemolysin